MNSMALLTNIETGRFRIIRNIFGKLMSRIDSSAYAALTRCSGRTEMTENCILGHCNNDERAYSRELLDRDGWLETDGL